MSKIDAAPRWREQLHQWTAPPPEVADPAAAGGDGWRRYADWFRTLNKSVQGREEPLVRFLAPWLTPGVTVLDVGAGGGRFALALAERGARVTAVEPSEGMRGVLAEAVAERGLAVDMVATRWPAALADVTPADIVLCANVAYDVADLAPFVQALDQAARRVALLFLSLSHPVGQSADLWRRFRGWEVPHGPTYLDAAAVLFEVGIPVNITLLPVESTMTFADWDMALAVYRQRLGLEPRPDRDKALREALAETLIEQDGQLVVQPRQRQAAVIWWEKGLTTN